MIQNLVLMTSFWVVSKASREPRANSHNVTGMSDSEVSAQVKALKKFEIMKATRDRERAQARQSVPPVQRSAAQIMTQLDGLRAQFNAIRQLEKLQAVRPSVPQESKVDEGTESEARRQPRRSTSPAPRHQRRRRNRGVQGAMTEAMVRSQSSAGNAVPSAFGSRADSNDMALQKVLTWSLGMQKDKEDYQRMHELSLSSMSNEQKLAQALSKRINECRLEQGLKPLSWDDDMAVNAEKKAQAHVLKKDYEEGKAFVVYTFKLEHAANFVAEYLSSQICEAWKSREQLAPIHKKISEDDLQLCGVGVYTADQNAQIGQDMSWTIVLQLA